LYSYYYYIYGSIMTTRATTTSTFHPSISSCSFVLMYIAPRTP
jgi:hypothetical protein